MIAVYCESPICAYEVAPNEGHGFYPAFRLFYVRTAAEAARWFRLALDGVRDSECRVFLGGGMSCRQDPAVLDQWRHSVTGDDPFDKNSERSKGTYEDGVWCYVDFWPGDDLDRKQICIESARELLQNLTRQVPLGGGPTWLRVLQSALQEQRGADSSGHT